MAEVEKKQLEGKRALPIAILDVLQRETDASHGLEASEIRVVLERDYELTATEKTIREHCKALQGFAPLGCEVLRLNRGDIGPDGAAILGKARHGDGLKLRYEQAARHGLHDATEEHHEKTRGEIADGRSRAEHRKRQDRECAIACTTLQVSCDRHCHTKHEDIRRR